MSFVPKFWIHQECLLNTFAGDVWQASLAFPCCQSRTTLDSLAGSILLRDDRIPRNPGEIWIPVGQRLDRWTIEADGSLGLRPNPNLFDLRAPRSVEVLESEPLVAEASA